MQTTEPQCSDENVASEHRSSSPPIRLSVDLGCGAAKQPGYIGLDRFPLKGVDIVCDLDCGIPLSTGSVERLLASHSLEHVRDLQTTMAEVFRVCADRALVTIIAPYESTTLNRANPYHRFGFNEHTPRFFTDHANDLVEPSEYSFPAAEPWGLQSSDHSSSNVDLRCVRMEFVYLPAYRRLDTAAQRVLRKALSDVCDQIALYLVVVKSPIEHSELSDLALLGNFPTTPAFESRRHDENGSFETNCFADLPNLRGEIRESVEAIGALGGEVRRLHDRLGALEKQVVSESARNDRLIAELDGADVLLGERITAVNSAAAARFVTFSNELHQRQATFLKEAREDQSRRSRELSTQFEEARQKVYDEIADVVLSRLVRDRINSTDFAWRPVRYARRYLSRRRDLRASLGGDLAVLWADAGGPQNGMKVLPSTFLQPNVVRSYPIVAGASQIARIEIGVICMFPPSGRHTPLAYELIDPANNTVLRAGQVYFHTESDHQLLSIEFAPVSCDRGRAFVIRFAPNHLIYRVGARLLEWQRVSRILHRVDQVHLACRVL
jgi:hypothetical protein